MRSSNDGCVKRRGEYEASAASGRFTTAVPFAAGEDLRVGARPRGSERAVGRGLPICVLRTSVNEITGLYSETQGVVPDSYATVHRSKSGVSHTAHVLNTYTWGGQTHTSQPP